MKLSALQEYLKQYVNPSSQTHEILDKFLLYIKMVQDPFNVFRYMQEKSICIYFPLFWISKSEYLAEIGDYKNAFSCLKEAESRIGVIDQDQNQKIINTKLKAQTYREQISNEILKYPSPKKRSIGDFNLLEKKSDPKYENEDQINQQLGLMIQNKYQILKLQKEKRFAQKNEDKPKSWLFEYYEKQKNKIYEIITQTLSRTNEKNQNENKKSPRFQQRAINNNQRLFKSVNTPLKPRDPMRMVKTVDSVEMMRRKRKESNQKFRKNAGMNQIQSDEQEQDVFDSNRSMSIATMPVSGRFGLNTKHVKFQKTKSIIELESIRGEHQEQDKSIQISRNTEFKNKSILRKKTFESKQLKFEKINNQNFPSFDQ